jgi:hypothetical protein
MKGNNMKLVVMVCLAALVAGCTCEVRPTTTYEESGVGDCHPFTLKGHTYLRFGMGNTQSVVHDPDCQCQTKK